MSQLGAMKDTAHAYQRMEVEQAMAVLYSKSYGGLHLLLRLYGSAIPRTLLASLLSSALAALLFYVSGRNYFEGLWRHPYPFQLFAFVVGFMLVFRSNLGYSRYWEGRSQVQLMSAHWADLVVKALAFQAASRSSSSSKNDSSSSNNSRDGGSGQRLQAFADQTLHLASLLHGLCLQHLRRDWRLSNLRAHSPGCPPPPADARGLPGYHVGWLQLLTLRAGGSARMRYHRAMKLAVLGGVTQQELQSLGEPRERSGGATTATLLTGMYQPLWQEQREPRRGMLQWLSERLEVETGGGGVWLSLSQGGYKPQASADAPPQWM